MHTDFNIKYGPEEWNTLDVYHALHGMAGGVPGFVFVHGGGGFKCTKSDTPFVELCKALTHEGISAISIEYQKTPLAPRLREERQITAVRRAARDVRMALDFVHNNAKIGNVDTSRIFAGGASFGAVAALTGIYTKPDLAIQHFAAARYDRHIAGVVSMWGCLPGPRDRPSMKTDMGINWFKKFDPPLQLIHGNMDRNEFTPIEASDEIKRQADEAGLTCNMLTLGGANHAPWHRMDSIVECIVDFVRTQK